jgi:cell division protein FtsW
MTGTRIVRILLVTVVALVSIGIVMLASTSTVRGVDSHSDPLFFLKKQLVWLALATVVALALARFDYHQWQDRRILVPMVIGTVVMLVAVLVPGIRREIGGSYRWLRLGPLSVQPSEFAKLVVVIAMAAWIEHVRHGIGDWKKGLLPALGGLGVVTALVLLEPDYGTTVLVGLVGGLILLAGGAKFWQLFLAGLLAAIVIIAGLRADPVRWKRVEAFFDDKNHPTAAHQTEQSKVAFRNGGLFGVGLGRSIQKQHYLPEAHTDFILAIIGEELGFFASIGVLLLFSAIVVCGLTVAMHAPDIFGRLLSFGFSMLIGLQVVFNVAVVTDCLPNKGLPLPFISYGGSSMLVSFAAVAILMNVAVHCGEKRDRHTEPIKDRVHRV